MIRRPPRSTLDRSSAASDVYKRQGYAITRNLMEGETDTLSPTSTYKPSAAITFLYKDRFETGNSFHSVESETELTTTTSVTDVFEGLRLSLIHI